MGHDNLAQRNKLTRVWVSIDGDKKRDRISLYRTWLTLSLVKWRGAGKLFWGGSMKSSLMIKQENYICCVIIKKFEKILFDLDTD